MAGMKCCCHIHREMNSAASAIWAAGAASLALLFFTGSLDFTIDNILYWWVSVVTLRLVAVETVRYVMLRKNKAI